MANNGFTFNGQNLDTVLVPRSFFNQGSLWGWGTNYYGQAGINALGGNYYSPVQTVTGGINWKQGSSGNEFTATIKDDGSLWTWGRNNYGQLGGGTLGVSQSSPIQTSSGGLNWSSVSCSSAGGFTVDRFTTAVKTDGTLWTWGRNSQGEIGDNTTTQRAAPTQTVSGGAMWFKSAAGGNHVLALKTDGTLWAWGNNNYGQLGDNSVTKKSSPVQVVSGGTTWAKISAGASFSAAIKTDGTLWIWGRNNYGQLGINSTTDISSPIQTVSGGTNWNQIDLGARHSLSVKTDGTLWAWGDNGSGRLGNNTTTATSSPIQTIASGTNWSKVSAGYAFSGAIKTDGTLWTWGENSTGALADNTNVAKSSPVQTIAGGYIWSTISAGDYAAMAMTYVYSPY